MVRCSFTWKFDEQLNCFCLTDHYSDLAPTMSLTNDITEICKRDNRIKTLPVLYRDTDGTIDEVIPTFSGNECIGVDFKFREYSKFEDYGKI